MLLNQVLKYIYMCIVSGQSVDLFALKHQLVGVSIFATFVYGHATRFLLW